MAGAVHAARREPRRGEARRRGRARRAARLLARGDAALVVDSMERVLRPLVYAESLDLVELHRGAASPCTSSPRRCRRSSGDRRRPRLRRCARHGVRGGATASTRAARCARCTRRTRPTACAQSPRARFDLDASTAYSDSHTDLPFLEAVGHPVVVNPDRELRRIARSAAGRCWSSAGAVQRRG